MKLLVDAQLPRRLAREISALGHDALHTFDLPLGNRTSDDALSAMAAREERVLITKDSDFVNSFWLRRSPLKLLLISIGNISNDALRPISQRSSLRLYNTISWN